MRALRHFLLAVLFGTIAFAADSTAKRIVSLSPSTTEILYGVGAFPRVVGVSQYCTYPPEVAKLPRVGGWQTSDVEKILALHPDLVVLTDAQAPFISDRLSAFGIHFIAVPSKSLADVFSAIRSVGEATGNQAKAAILTRDMHASLDALRAKTERLPRRGVLLSVSRTPGTLSDLYVATTGSYLIDLVEIAGGQSVVEPAERGYGKISKEAILTLNPEIIIDLVHGSKARFGEHAADVWNDLPELRAVREKHVYPVDDPFIPHPSQFVTRTAEAFAHIIHPEIFAERAH
jgi:iron complex transport system substrate-binding protein